MSEESPGGKEPPKAVAALPWGSGDTEGFGALSHLGGLTPITPILHRVWSGRAGKEGILQDKFMERVGGATGGV